MYVGHRWRRLNYNTLGQNVLDPRYFGLMIHVHTFNDLSEANLAPTWGARYALNKRDGVFEHSNPYRTIALEDHFGKYAKIPNEPAREHKKITISRIYWGDAKDAPEAVRNSASPPNPGRLFVHGEEWFDDAGDYLQYRPFLRAVDPNFVLRAPGQPEIKCRASSLFITLASQNIREFEIIIPPEVLARMAKRTPYTLHPASAEPRLPLGSQGRVVAHPRVLDRRPDRCPAGTAGSSGETRRRAREEESLNRKSVPQ